MAKTDVSISFAENAGDTAARLERLLKDLPETISLEDVQHHDWLKRIVRASYELANRTEFSAIQWAKAT